MLLNLKKTECIILNEKFQFCISELKNIDFVCDFDNRFSEMIKIIKIFK